MSSARKSKWPKDRARYRAAGSSRRVLRARSPASSSSTCLQCRARAVHPRGRRRRRLARKLPAFKSDTLRLKDVRGDLVRLLFEFLNRDEHGCSADRGRTTAKRADAVLDHARVAMNHGHVVDMNAELICCDLRERRFLSLTVR